MAITEVNLSLEDGLVCQIFTKSHIVAADDPADPDVEEEGPNPLEYLLAALASSAAMAVKEEALRRALTLEEVQVSVKWRTSHRALLEPGEQLPPTALQREMRVRVTRDITEAERDALLAAAKASPVDRALAGGTRVEDALFVFGYASEE